MTYSLTWLPDVLRAAGLKVDETDGWQARGHGDMSTVQGVLCHETDGAATGNMPTLQVLIDGRSDLAGPLAQLGLGRDGTFYIVAAGKCWHAGEGGPHGGIAHNDGNAHLIGIEAEHQADETWTTTQLDAYQRGVAAILKHIGVGAQMVLGHKEWAPGRKDDPKLIDMAKFRTAVASILAGATTIPPIAGPVIMTAITATVFGGRADPNTSAYDASHVINDTELSVALPYRFASPRPKVTVRCGSKVVTCDINDVGPWNTNDPYWRFNARPQAETGTDTRGRHTNKAGIDLSPAAAKAIGIDGKGVVDWWFADATVVPTPAPVPPAKVPPVTTPTQPDILGFAESHWRDALIIGDTLAKLDPVKFGFFGPLNLVLRSIPGGMSAPASGVTPASPLPSTPSPPGLPDLIQWINSQKPPEWAVQLLNQLFAQKP